MKPITTIPAMVLFTLAASGAARPAIAAANGEQLFHQDCAICHDTTPGQNKIGPSLAGVYGRAAGQASGFDYSTAMASSGLTWDDKTLDRYLTNPRTTVPGNKMLFPGVRNPDQRQAVIAYLKTLKP